MTLPAHSPSRLSCLVAVTQHPHNPRPVPGLRTCGDELSRLPAQQREDVNPSCGGHFADRGIRKLAQPTTLTRHGEEDRIAQQRLASGVHGRRLRPEDELATTSSWVMSMSTDPGPNSATLVDARPGAAPGVTGVM